MRRGYLSLIAVVSLVNGLAGCAITQAPPEPEPTVTTPAMPARPREIRMDGVDPCTLVSRDLLAEIDVGSEQRRRSLNLVDTSTTLCEWSNRSAKPIVTLSVWAVPDKSMNEYRNEPGSALTNVAGFPALDSEYGSYEPSDACMVQIDTAANQGVWIHVTVEAGKLPGASHELMCRKAHIAAEGVMRTLLARTG